MNWSAYWHGYRRTTGDLTFRLATPADLPAIRRLRNVSERFLNQKQRSPSMFELPVLLALVAENAQGKVVDAIYVEAQVELVKLACTAQGLEASAGLEDDLSNWLRSIGFKSVIATSPLSLTDRMGHVFERLGFRRTDGSLAFWRRRL